MAAIEKKARRYPTDLADEEWSQVEGLLPKPRKTGRRRGVDLREMAPRRLSAESAISPSTPTAACWPLT
jgi:transposase